MRIWITSDRWLSFVACSPKCSSGLSVHSTRTAWHVLDLARLHVACLVLLDSAYTEWPVLLNRVWCIVLMIILMVIESWCTSDTILSVRCHTKTRDHHTLLNTVACTKMLLVWHISTDKLVWKNLTESLNVHGEIEILRYLLNPLANHGSLNNVFRTHCATTWQGCGTSIARPKWHRVKWVSWNLWARSKDLPDLEGPLELDHLNRLNWIRILAIVWSIFRLKHAGYFTNLIAVSTQRLSLLLLLVQSNYVPATSANWCLLWLPIGLNHLTSLGYWSAIRSRIDSAGAWETLSYERIDIYA